MTQQQPRISVIAALRHLVPHRALSYAEAERIVELQANRLRELLKLDDPHLPEEAIGELPRMLVRREFGLPVSGMTYWQSGRWVITLNGSESAGRVRFSLAHEFCHVLHHGTREAFYSGANGYKRAERLADYFAGCLLMPKRHVKRLSGEGLDSNQLARTFGVSVPAVRVRLLQLGLGEPMPRCDWSSGRSGRAYFRRSRSETRVAA